MTSFLPRSLAVAALAILVPLAACAQDLALDRIKLPPGFEINVYANVPTARSLALGQKGTVFVGTRQSAVYAIVPREGGQPEVVTIADGLNAPNGVAFRAGALELPQLVEV